MQENKYKSEDDTGVLDKYILEFPVGVNYRSVLSDIAATGCVWLWSTWNVTCSNWEVVQV